MNTDSVVPLVRSEQTRAGDVLGRAFFDDPQWVALMPGDDLRRQRLPLMFIGATKMTMFAGGFPERTNGFEAVALWLPPGRDIGPMAMLRSSPTSVRWAFARPKVDVRRMTRVLKQFDQKKKQLMPEPHWYLMAIGVDPDHQGEGHGSTLVRAGIEKADRDGKMIYLETETEQNVGFYQNLGFEVLDEMTLTDLDIPFSLMIRRPQT